jgi:hypothetical protein
MLKKRKLWYWVFKISSIVTACAFPLYAVYEHFPYWQYEFGATRSLGSGFIISAIVIAVIFRKTVFNFIAEKVKGKHAPPIAIWIGLLITTYILIYINAFLVDLTTVLWMGLIGCAIGNGLTYIAEHKFGEPKEDK